MSTTITTKGQVTIPKAMRDHLGLGAGDRVDFAYADDGSVRVQPVRKPRAKAKRSKFTALIGIRNKGKRTDRLMEMLRGYASDKDDPGFR